MKKWFGLISLLVLVLVLAGCNTLLQDITGDLNDRSPVFNIGQDLVAPEDLDHDPNHILIRPDSLDSLEQLGLEAIREWAGIEWAKVAVPEGETVTTFINKLRQEENILAAEPNLVYETDDEEIDYRDRLWGMENINAPVAWDITTGCEEVIVAIIDTGIDVTHPEWEEHVFVGSYNATDDPYPADIDFSGHGTHVAGTAVSPGDSGKIQGVAWNTPLMNVRVMEYEEGLILTEFLTEAMLYLGDYAEDSGQRIVANMSIGGPGYSLALKDAIDYAKERGVLLVTSAGNARKQVISFPSAYNSVVSVAASDGNNQKAGFSTTGFWNSVAAPGVKTWSTYPEHLEPAGYAYLQGTSMAAPHVTGAAALLLSHNPDLTPLEIRNQMEQTAQGSGFTPELGHGIIDVAAMLGELKPMQYGGLAVQSNVVYGIVTLSHEGELAFFGATNEVGQHLFPALQPGTYTVTLSWNGMLAEKEVTITVDDVQEIELFIEMEE